MTTNDDSFEDVALPTEDDAASIAEVEPVAEAPLLTADEPAAAEIPPPAPTAEPVAAAERKPIETWAKELGTADWLFAATKMHAGWPRGREVTQAEFEAATKAVDGVTCR